jgi:hypothetical protein
VQVNLASKPWGGEEMALTQEETMGYGSGNGSTRHTSEALAGASHDERWKAATE